MRTYLPNTAPTPWRLGLTILLLSAPVFADGLSGAQSLLCYGWTAALCDTDNGCQTAEPWRFNLPDFVNVDLRARVVETTATAAEQRSTAIRTLERGDGMILLQGNQNNRAFSWLITESTGEGTLTVSEPGVALSVFTVCTPSQGR